MKKLFEFIGLLTLSCCLGMGCIEKGKQNTTVINPESKFIENLAQKDTAEILNLTELWLDTIKAGKIDDALNFVYCIQNDTLMPLSTEMKNSLKYYFKCFPIKDYQLVSFDINGFYANTVKYNICFKEQEGTPYSVKFAFNPIWIDNTWYLTLKNN